MGQPGHDLRRRRGEDLHWTLSNLFDAMGAMSSKYNDEAVTASRAYDVDRDGFVIAGAALAFSYWKNWSTPSARRLYLRRGRRLWRDLGWPRHGGAVGRRRGALHEHGTARIVKVPVDYINPHATATPVGDAKESEEQPRGVRQQVPADLRRRSR